MNRRHFLRESSCSLLALAAGRPISIASPAPAGIWSAAKRVVFLGDSITYSGGYVAYLETQSILQTGRIAPEFLNLGLSSETVSGLSEDGHAQGRFPRPDLHERLERVLSKTKPDIVFACYGMNCGIYHPFSEERFAAYRNGIQRLRTACARSGSAIILITPSVFDPEPIRSRVLPAGLDAYPKPFAGYNEVLDRYSAWLVSMGAGAGGWTVVDTHSGMNAYLAEQRERDPQFRLARDGVHIDATGHWLVSREIAAFLWGRRWSGDSFEAAMRAEHPAADRILELVQKRQHLLRDAWLGETGHKRPGIKTGLPLSEANAAGAKLNGEIRALLAAK